MSKELIEYLKLWTEFQIFKFSENLEFDREDELTQMYINLHVNDLYILLDITPWYRKAMLEKRLDVFKMRLEEL